MSAEAIDAVVQRFLRRLPDWARSESNKVLRGAQAAAYLAGLEHARAEQSAFLMRHPDLLAHYTRCTLDEVNHE